MAKIVLGALAGQVSGSIGCQTYSHNRFGAYVRNRVVPVTSTTPAALAAKAYMTTATQAWQGLTASQKLEWNNWAVTNPVTDVLGNPQVLTGHTAYVGNACRMLRAGNTMLAVPPIIPGPLSLATLSLSLDIGLGQFEAIFAGSPLGANDKLLLKACVVDSAGISYVQNLLRTIVITAAAQASPYDFQTDIETKFGVLQVGQYVHVQAYVFGNTSGQLSAPLKASGIVVTT